MKARTLGKTVTLPKGVVVTDVGPARSNGRETETIRRCVDDNGKVYEILSRVVDELPITYRRADLP